MECAGIMGAIPFERAMLKSPSIPFTKLPANISTRLRVEEKLAAAERAHFLECGKHAR